MGSRPVGRAGLGSARRGDVPDIRGLRNHQFPGLALKPLPCQWPQGQHGLLWVGQPWFPKGHVWWRCGLESWGDKEETTPYPQPRQFLEASGRVLLVSPGRHHSVSLSHLPS